MLLTSFAIISHNAILESNDFILWHLLIDNGGTVLALQQCHVIPRHKMHLYILVTVLQTQHNI